MRKKLSVDWTLCTGHLVCADILPELVTVDDWGYPVIPDRPVPARLMRHARRARATCPALALRLVELPPRRRETGSRDSAPRDSAPRDAIQPAAPTLSLPRTATTSGPGR